MRGYFTKKEHDQMMEYAKSEILAKEHVLVLVNTPVDEDKLYMRVEALEAWSSIASYCAWLGRNRTITGVKVFNLGDNVSFEIYDTGHSDIDHHYWKPEVPRYADIEYDEA